MSEKTVEEKNVEFVANVTRLRRQIARLTREIELSTQTEVAVDSVDTANMVGSVVETKETVDNG